MIACEEKYLRTELMIISCWRACLLGWCFLTRLSCHSKGANIDSVIISQLANAILRPKYQSAFISDGEKFSRLSCWVRSRENPARRILIVDVSMPAYINARSLLLKEAGENMSTALIQFRVE